MTNDTILIVCMFLSRLIGIIEWTLVFFVTMEVVICRDARHGDITKILNSPLMVRWKLFKRSWKSLFYKGTWLIWLCSLYSVIEMISDLWLGHFPQPPYTWTIISLFLPIGIFIIYIAKGYRITLFQKFHLFMLDQHE